MRQIPHARREAESVPRHECAHACHQLECGLKGHWRRSRQCVHHLHPAPDSRRLPPFLVYVTVSLAASGPTASLASSTRLHLPSSEGKRREGHETVVGNVPQLSCGTRESALPRQRHPRHRLGQSWQRKDQAAPPSSLPHGAQPASSPRSCWLHRTSPEDKPAA